MNKKLHIIIGLFVIVLDQITKLTTLANLKEFQSVAIVPNFFSITFVRNTGAAWGILNNSTILLTLFSVAIIVLFMYMYITYSQKSVKLLLAIIIAGAIGNLIDRIRLGYVVDFFDFNLLGYHFPVFNIADIAISLGTVLLIIYLMKSEGKQHANR